MSGSRPVLLLMDFQDALVERLRVPAVVDAADRRRVGRVPLGGGGVVSALRFSAARLLLLSRSPGYRGT